MFRTYQPLSSKRSVDLGLREFEEMPDRRPDRRLNVSFTVEPRFLSQHCSQQSASAVLAGMDGPVSPRVFNVEREPPNYIE
jgi:hypothetical protein